jgi:hypothetical protein
MLDIELIYASLQGTGDQFYKSGQLLPENFLKAARDAGHDEFQVRVRSHVDYDHSYYFVSGFSRSPPIALEAISRSPPTDIHFRVGPHPL